MTQLNMETLADVRVTVTVMLGRATAPIGEVLKYAAGTIVPLDVSADAPAPLLVNGVAIATGEIVSTDDGCLAIEIRDVLTEQGWGSR